MRYLYTNPVPQRQANREQGSLRQRLTQKGLLDRDTRAVRQISLDEDTVTIDGNWRYGSPIDEKLARELESLGESSFGSVPLFAPDGELERAGYYEVERAEVSQAHPTLKDVWDFSATLTLAGTQETDWRSLSTNRQDAANPYDDGSDPLLGVDAFADKAKWYTTKDGTEPATPVDTVDSEFGDVALYDPTDASFDDPSLIYEVPFAREGRVDVVVWDDRDRAKYRTVTDADTEFDDGSTYDDGSTFGETQRTTVWDHVFHTGWERSGDFVVENGRLRVRFDEAEQLLRPFRWDGTAWQSVAIDHTEWRLLDATPDEINAANAVFVAEFTNGSSVETVRLSLQRGAADLLVREPDDGSIPSGLESMLSPVALGWTDDLSPVRGTVARSDTETQ